MVNDPSTSPDIPQALARFADPATPPEARQAALSTLSASKALPRQAEDAAVLAGRSLLLEQARTAAEPQHRLLAIAECVRLGQIVKRWQAPILEQLRPAFADPLPPMQWLGSGDDRLNLARACSQLPMPWMPDYLAQSIAQEATAEKVRLELARALMQQSSGLAELFSRLARAFEGHQPDTHNPADTVARRLARSIEAVRALLQESETGTGDGLGPALHDWISAALLHTGAPQDGKVLVELLQQVLLLVHDLVRSRVSVAADPAVYQVVGYCRRLAGGRAWPKALEKPLERLVADVSEALVLLGRQGQRDQMLLAQLDVLCDSSEQARKVACRLAEQHPEFSEEVRDWLEHGRIRPLRRASEAAIEAASSNADESIGLALQAARITRMTKDQVKDALISNLEIYDPSLVSSVRTLFDGMQTLLIQIEQAAALRDIDLHGTVGEEIEVSPKYFSIIGDKPRQKMTVRQPAIVRRRSDGGIGEVLIKGLVD